MIIIPLRKSSPGAIFAESALIQAQQGLRKTQARQQDVSEVAGALKALRKHNHFGDKLRKALGGKDQ
ncbi:MAG: DUF7620 family protein [bacterium]